MAYVQHELLMDLPVSTLWETFEAHEQRLREAKGHQPDWLTWREFAAALRGAADPSVVNCAELRSGLGCVTGRGLRGNARALCHLYEETLPAEDFRTRLQVETLEEWAELSHCLEAGMGWQLFRFRRLDGRGEVLGHGYADSATGSIALRVPGASIAVLLNRIGATARQPGMELITVVARHLGLVPVWHLDRPSVPDAAGNKLALIHDSNGDLRAHLSRVEEQIARLSEVVESVIPGAIDVAVPDGLDGHWESVATRGLDAMLDAFQVPSMARPLVKRLRRKLTIEMHGDSGSIVSKAFIAGREVESASVKFIVGEPFQGEQQLGGKFSALATWVDAREGPPSKALLVTKRFELRGREVVLDEQLELTPEGQLALTNTLRGHEEIPVLVESREDCEFIRRNLDPSGLQLQRDIRLGTVWAWHGGHLIDAGSANPITDLLDAPLPRTVKLRYDDIECSTIFDRSGGRSPRRAVRPAARGMRALPSSADRANDEGSSRSSECLAGTAVVARATCRACGVGLVATGRVLWPILRSTCWCLSQALGEALQVACAGRPAGRTARGFAGGTAHGPPGSAPRFALEAMPMLTDKPDGFPRRV